MKQWLVEIWFDSCTVRRVHSLAKTHYDFHELLVHSCTVSLTSGRARLIPYICSAGQVLPRNMPLTMSTEGNDRAMGRSAPDGSTTSKSIPVSVSGAHTSGGSVTSTSSNSISSTTTANRRRSQTEGYSTQTLRFLERTDTPAYRSSPSLSINPYPVGYTAPQSPARPSMMTVQPRTSGPRNSPLAFLERVPSRIPPSISATSLINGPGGETGLESLHEGVLAGDFARRSRFGDDDFRDSHDWDEEDDNVCPSIICSVFPCLAFLW